MVSAVQQKLIEGTGAGGGGFADQFCGGGEIAGCAKAGGGGGGAAGGKCGASSGGGERGADASDRHHGLRVAGAAMADWRGSADGTKCGRVRFVSGGCGAFWSSRRMGGLGWARNEEEWCRNRSAGTVWGETSPLRRRLTSGGERGPDAGGLVCEVVQKKTNRGREVRPREQSQAVSRAAAVVQALGAAGVVVQLH